MSSSENAVEADIRALYAALLKGWNGRDAAAMARLFAPDGHVVGFDGSQIDGAPAIEAATAAIFSQHKTPPFVSILREMRMLSPDTALLRAVVGMAPPGRSELDPALNAIQSLVAQRREGEWRIALFQNTPAAFHGRPELVAQMTAELGAARGKGATG